MSEVIYLNGRFVSETEAVVSVNDRGFLFGDAVYGSRVNSGANLASYTINALESLLYPAIRGGLKQPDSNPRLGVAKFCRKNLALEDVQELTPDLFELIANFKRASDLQRWESKFLAGMEALQ